MILESLFETKVRRTVAVPFPYDDAVLSTIARAAKTGLAHFTLIGDLRRIGESMAAFDITSGLYSCLEASDETSACELMRREAVSGRADAVMKGDVHTAVFSRAILSSESGLIGEGDVASHIAACELPDAAKAILLTDCAINIEPDYKTKLKILQNALLTARRLGIEKPRVALVAPVETVNPKIQSTVDAACLVQEYNDGTLAEVLGPAVIEGPFGLDVALSSRAAEIKGIQSEVAGNADILLFPDLNSGNAVYKALTVAAGAQVAGNLIGPKIPVVLSSRSDDENTKLLSLKMALRLAESSTALE